MISIYDNRANVMELQVMLREISKNNAGVRLINPDGLFLEETAEAVAAVQSMSGLDPNGRVNFNTWVSITNMFENNIK